MIHPKPYLSLICQYRDYIHAPPLLFDLDTDPVTGETSVKINLEFVAHPIYGKTRLRIRERYDSGGHLYFYRYCWEINKKPTGHISAWENEHGHGLSTDPHHHHHVPFDRKKVKENADVRSLEDVLKIVIPYFISGKEYP